jgi:alpha-tubulin suppressor-like RCC1 family protein
MLECLTYKPSYKSGHPSTNSIKDSLLLPSEVPTRIEMGETCTFVVTSTGRCFSFGTSAAGLLGHGAHHAIMQEPSEMKSLPSAIRSLSIGAGHAVALCSNGKAYTWGRVPESPSTIVWHPKRVGDGKIVAASAGLDMTVLVNEMGTIYSYGKKSGRLGLGEVLQDQAAPRPMFGGLQLWR